MHCPRALGWVSCTSHHAEPETSKSSVAQTSLRTQRSLSFLSYQDILILYPFRVFEIHTDKSSAKTSYQVTTATVMIIIIILHCIVYKTYTFYYMLVL